ncbi:unnamed protein product [Victoria cruziana]
MARPRALGRSAGSFLVVLFCSRHEKDVRKRYAQRMEDRVSVVSLSSGAFLTPQGQFLVLAPCAPFRRVSRPVHSQGCWPTKHLPAAPAGRLAGSALVILTVLSAGAPSHCSSHKRWQLQLAPAGARPARPEWAPRSAPLPLHSFELRGGVSRFFFQPDLERYYESSVPDSLAAAIWFTGTTKNSLASVTDVSKISDHETKTPVVLLVSIPKLILEAQAPSCSAIRTWSPYHGEGKITL